MIARVLLPARPEFSIQQFNQALQSNLAGAADVGNARKADGKITIPIDQSILQIGISSSPVPWNLEDVVRLSEQWPADRTSLDAHNSQLIFCISGDGVPTRQAMYLTMAAMIALEQCPLAIGVYWESAGQCIPVTAFQAVASDASELQSLWVSVLCTPKWQGAIGCTRGMAAFGQREIETQNATEPPHELLARLNGLVDYLLQNGPIVKDGETFGQTASEKIQVRYTDQSAFGNKGPIMTLDYSGTRVIDGDQMVVPDRVGVPSFSSETHRKGRLGILVAIAALLFFAVVGWFGLSLMIRGGGEDETVAADGEALIEIVRGGNDAASRLRAAEKLVSSGDQMFFGNTDDATELARRFNKWFNLNRGKQVELGEIDESFDGRRNETYCELRGNSAVFICHAPGFSKAGLDTRKAIETLAWESGFRETRELGKSQLAVAIRDGDSYGSIQTGPVARVVRQGNAMIAGGIAPPSKQTTDDKALVPYFELLPPATFANSGGPSIKQPPEGPANQPDQKKTAVRDRNGGNRPPAATQEGVAVNAGSLRYRWNDYERVRYRANLSATINDAEVDSTASFSIMPKQRARSTIGTVSGTITTFVKNPRAMQGLMMIDPVIFDARFDVDDNGKIIAGCGQGYVPIVGHMVATLPVLEFPSDNRNSWKTQRDVIVRTVESPRGTDPGVVIDPQIRYAWFQEAKGGAGVFGGRPDPAGLPPMPGFDARPERLLDTCDATETCDYTILKEQGDLVTISCDCALKSKHVSEHEVTYKGEFIFNRREGLIEKIELSGKAEHRNATINIDAPFSLVVRRVSEEELQRLAADRKRRAEEREKQRAASPEKDETETKQTTGQFGGSMVQAQDLVTKLASDDRAEVRDALRELRSKKKIKPPSDDIGAALISLLVKNPTETNVSVLVLRSWISDEMLSRLLDVLPMIDDSISFANACTVLRENGTDGIAEKLIECLGKTELRSRVTLELNRYDEEIEPLFFAVLDDSDDREVLLVATRWLTFKGTRKSVSRLKRLAKRAKGDNILRMTCEGAVRVIENRNRSR